jgi:rfaE bifunctional protein kinase chain/domain
MSKIVFVSGNFFVLHPGHIRFLRFASECGSKLVVGVNDTLPNPSYPTPSERRESLMSLGFVDEVVVMESGLEATLRALRPHIVVKGKEYESVHNLESVIISEWSGAVLYSSGDASYSATELIAPASSDEIRWVRPQSYMRRHAVSLDRSREIVSRFSDLTVIVIGDLIIDEYIHCEALGMSREDPTVVVSPQNTDRFLGGAGIVAAHAQGLGATAHFLSVAGSDEAGKWSLDRINEYGVQAEIVSDGSRPTTLKKRYRVGSKTMLRVSHLRQHEIGREISEQILDAFSAIVGRADLLVFADFNYGCLPQTLVDSLISQARDFGLTIAADSQSSSQLGNIARFQRVDLLTPTEHEARLALRAQNEGLPVIGARLLAAAKAKRGFITLGPTGLLVFDHADEEFGMQSDQLPALNRNPADVAGAGDSLLIASSMSLALGASTFEAAYLGSVAAAIQTSRVGNVPIKQSEIMQALH